jgi:hypothetical protein
MDMNLNAPCFLSSVRNLGLVERQDVVPECLDSASSGIKRVLPTQAFVQECTEYTITLITIP